MYLYMKTYKALYVHPYVEKGLNLLPFHMLKKKPIIKTANGCYQNSLDIMLLGWKRKIRNTNDNGPHKIMNPKSFVVGTEAVFIYLTYVLHFRPLITQVFSNH